MNLAGALTRTLLTAALIALGTLAASAQNPKLSLRLQNATAAEAVEALSRAADVSVRIQDFYTGPDAPKEVAARLAERREFQWSGVIFADALRQVCAAYHLSLSHHAGGYTLSAGGIPVVREASNAVEVVERAGVRLEVRSADISQQRGLRFAGQQQAAGQNRLSVEVHCRLREGPGAAIIGFDNLVAVDDQGNVLVGDFALPHFSPFGQTYPDEWVGRMHLMSVHPRATKLLWLEGELIAYRIVRPVSLELTLGPDGKGRGALPGGVSAEILRLELPRPEEGGASLRARVILPQAAAVVSLLDPHSSVKGVALVGESGRTYVSGGLSSSGMERDAVTTYEMNFSFGVTPAEPIRKVVFRFQQKAEPVRLTAFRMRNIPLPAEVAFTPRREVPPRTRGLLIRAATPPGPPPPDGPFRQAGGGTLAAPVRLYGRPAPAGLLSFGFAAKEGDDWGPTRWIDADVDGAGLARLTDVKPGAYRLLRIYRPKEAFGGAAGQWRNAQTMVTVEAGRELSLPLLEWVPEPEEPRRARPTPRGARPRTPGPRK